MRNAEHAVKVVKPRCGHCSHSMGDVYRVRNYHHVEPILTDPSRPQTRVIDLTDGLVLVSTWHATETPRKDRRKPIRNEWPVTDSAALFAWSPEHGMDRPTPEEVRAWAADAKRSERRQVKRFLYPNEC